jgi:hypothetical protein
LRDPAKWEKTDKKQQWKKYFVKKNELPSEPNVQQ